MFRRRGYYYGGWWYYGGMGIAVFFVICYIIMKWLKTALPYIVLMVGVLGFLVIVLTICDKQEREKVEKDKPEKKKVEKPKTEKPKVEKPKTTQDAVAEVTKTAVIFTPIMLILAPTICVTIYVFVMLSEFIGTEVFMILIIAFICLATIIGVNLNNKKRGE